MNLKNKVVGCTFVSGDLFHYGHLNFLLQCKKYCDFLIVGVNIDDIVTIRKGRMRPIIPFEERIAVFGALRIVDLVVPKTIGSLHITQNDVVPIMKKLIEDGYDIKMLFHGDDSKTVSGKEYIESIGGRFILIPYTKSISTASIINKIRKL